MNRRVEELRQLVAQTEREEKNQQEKYMRVLKEGEKALEEKTFQLARTRNEIQTQMTEFHELNSKINKLRTELKEIELNIRRGKDEAKKLAERRQEEKRIQETKIKVSFDFSPYTSLFNWTFSELSNTLLTILELRVIFRILKSREYGGFVEICSLLC